MITLDPARQLNALERPLAEVACQIDYLLDQLLEVPGDPSPRLFEAMRYAAIGGGKRLRPLLACASADLFDVPRYMSLRAGLAVECIHIHSLIHDDLPCMDDDDLRRGKATVHLAFDEANPRFVAFLRSCLRGFGTPAVNEFGEPDDLWAGVADADEEVE